MKPNPPEAQITALNSRGFGLPAISTGDSPVEFYGYVFAQRYIRIFFPANPLVTVNLTFYTGYTVLLGLGMQRINDSQIFQKGSDADPVRLIDMPFAKSNTFP